MAHSGSQVRSAPASPGHAAPLRGVLKRSWPPTPTVTAPLSPLSSPLISHIPLPQLDEDSSCNTSPNMHPHSHHRASIDDSSADSLPHRPISSSPPAHLQPSYTPKVSFDTFENPNATMFSFTLRVKSEGYKRVRSTRVFLCAASPDECGTEALDWCLQSLVQDGDELIVFRGVEQEELDKDHNILRVEARELMRTVQEKSYNFDPNRKLSLVLEYIPGKITDSLDRLIALYRPDSVVVGTRGRRSWQGMGMISMGSVSKYCLSHSPVPVIVVRPKREVKKTVEKRKADPKRGRHFE